MSDINYISSFDSTNLYAKISLGESPIANLIVVHGLTEELDDYDEVTAFFNEYDFNVIRYDQRSHSNTSGIKELHERIDILVEDLKAVVDYVKKQLTGEVFILGHGVGGSIAAMFGIKHPDEVLGFVSCGGLSPTGQPLLRDDAGDESSYEEEDKGMESVQKQRMIQNFRQRLHEINIDYKQFTDRVLIMHGGDDKVVSSDDAIQFYKEADTTHKSLRIYDGLNHELLNVTSYRGMLLSDIVNWLEFELSCIEQDNE